MEGTQVTTPTPAPAAKEMLLFRDHRQGRRTGKVHQSFLDIRSAFRRPARQPIIREGETERR
jgi:hypothetical protein